MDGIARYSTDLKGPVWMTSHTLELPAAQLYYEVRGSGPAVVLVGSPMAAAPFAALADALATDHTAITLDPRGISASRLQNPDADVSVEQRADDVTAILDALEIDSADVFGSSGGAVTGLAVVTRHPGRVGTLVAHEPPVQELLPDVAARRAEVADIVATFHRDGSAAAFAKFMAMIGVQPAAPVASAGQAPLPQRQPSAQEIADGARFLGHDMLATTRFVPDVAALTSSATRVVIGIGAKADVPFAQRTARVLAERLGIAPVEFPGGHGGFVEYPREFAAVLRKALGS
jgi:pimeloyl-ACP methyl ester carboxylesterase